MLVSNSTIQICDEFPGGLLRFQVIASVQPPHDIFILYIDGESVAQLVDVNEWIPLAVGLDAGEHRIDFSYQYNPFSVADLPPSPPTREGELRRIQIPLIQPLLSSCAHNLFPRILGAVWIDLVEIEALGTFEG